MRSSSLRARMFVAGAALLLAAVATASSPAPALAGDDSMFCPGTRCTGRQMPMCCNVVYPIPNGQEIDFYYFPNAS